MKKSQALAALAFAFALGVVAPVANIVSEAQVSALSFESAKESATAGEVANAINAVKSNDAYKKAMSVIDAYTAYTTGMGDGSYAEYAAGNAGKLVWRGVKYFGMTAPIAGVETSASYATIAETQAVIAEVKANDNYKLLDNLATAMESKDKAALMAAIVAYNEANPANKINVPNLTDDTKFVVDTAISTIKGGAWLNDYNDFAKLAGDTETNISAYQAGLAVLQPVLTSGILSAAGETAYNGAYDGVNNTETYSLAGLAGVIYNSTTNKYVDGNFVSTLNLTNWNKVNAAVVKPYDKGEATKTNWTVLHDIAVAYKTVTGTESPVSVVMAELANATVSPDDPTGTTMISAENVTIFANGFSFPAGTYVTVKKVNAGEIAGFAGFGTLKNAIFDIEVFNEDGTEYDMTGKNVTVVIAAEGFSNRAEGFHISDDGETVTALTGESYYDGALVFTTDHFSYYAIVETNPVISGGSDEKEDDKKAEADKKANTPDTGAIASSAASASKSAGIMASIATALTTAGAGIVAYRNNRRSSKKEA